MLFETICDHKIRLRIAYSSPKAKERLHRQFIRDIMKTVFSSRMGTSMAKESLQFLPPLQARQMAELADRARLSLSRFAATTVNFDAIGLQLLDEWIDRHLSQFPNPSRDIMTVWGAFLGEVFRRRFHGEWAIEQSQRKPRLGILCPREERGLLFVDVMDQIQRRIKHGMQESLALYYAEKGVAIREVEF